MYISLSYMIINNNAFLTTHVYRLSVIFLVHLIHSNLFSESVVLTFLVLYTTLILFKSQIMNQDLNCILFPFHPKSDFMDTLTFQECY
ncbi:Uncharacterised protein [Staphylococcus caeli]|uniref:Uncharacterized protein n=1 Tax=Staphylococcus caeli TaxID=2201815 RepID=A0A1D4KVG9_9STAP|nr:hypothetical protein SCC82B_00034 [Staphylococcus caeli]SCS78029.1 Uncharacterised protein [Staphylococcus caeli]SCS97735.1 Uncharacterised protein [Staphylococcus caeli]